MLFRRVWGAAVPQDSSPGWAAMTLKVTTLAALKALAPFDGMAADLGSAYQARFVFKAGDYTAQVAADTIGAIYVKANAIAARAGAWVRAFEGKAWVRWWDPAGTGQDGNADDTLAIDCINAMLNAGYVTDLNWNRVLRYTDVSLARNAAITLIDRSDWSIDMTGGSLLIDNLRPAVVDGTNYQIGSGGGIWIGGASRRWRLHNPTVEWARRATYRSVGDGITVKGKPNDRDCASLFFISGRASVKRSPQAGVIIMGARDFSIGDVDTQDLCADSLHFNACRAFTARGVRSTDSRTTDSLQIGDDALAFVNYYHPTDAGGGGAGWKTSTTPWNFSTLGDWSNANCVVGYVNAVGGRANGCRISGSQRVTVGPITARDKFAGAALVIDAVEALNGPQGRRGWRYLASRKVEVGTVQSENCQFGVLIVSDNSSTAAFQDFDVDIGSVTVEGATTHSVAQARSGGVRIGNIKSVNAALQAYQADMPRPGNVVGFIDVTGGAAIALANNGTAANVRVLEAKLNGKRSSGITVETPMRPAGKLFKK